MKIEGQNEWQVRQSKEIVIPLVEAEIETGDLPDAEKENAIVEDLFVGMKAKFVLVNSKDEDILKVFEPDITHADMCRDQEGERLVGAGEITGGFVNWGSHSCMQKFGHDRPSNEGEKTSKLALIEDGVKTWIREIATSES